MRAIRPEDLQVSWLKAFLALLETQSFSTAAEKLELSQPAISKRIQALERTIDQPLFERFGRSVHPLPAAHLLEAPAREVLARLTDAARALDELGGGKSGPLRVAISHHIALHQLPKWLDDSVIGATAIQVEWQFLDSDAAVDAVDHRLADLALVTLPEHRHPSHETQSLRRERMVLTTHRELPKHSSGSIPSERALRETPRALAQIENWLNTQTWVLPPRGSGTLERIRGLLAPLPLPSRHHSAPSIEIMRTLIENRMGIGFLPEDLIRPPLIAIGPPDWAVTRELGWLRIRHRARTAIENRFLKSLESRSSSPS
ncbi:MAG: LysR family transcriptional regulator [Thioalkalivibrionaceae bacterium]